MEIIMSFNKTGEKLDETGVLTVRGGLEIRIPEKGFQVLFIVSLIHHRNSGSVNLLLRMGDVRDAPIHHFLVKPAPNGTNFKNPEILALLLPFLAEAVADDGATQAIGEVEKDWAQPFFEALTSLLTRSKPRPVQEIS